MQGIDTITKYIKERKGVDIQVIPPRNIYEVQLFHAFAHIANDYFINKSNGNT